MSVDLGYAIIIGIHFSEKIKTYPIHIVQNVGQEVAIHHALVYLSFVDGFLCIYHSTS